MELLAGFFVAVLVLWVATGWVLLRTRPRKRKVEDVMRQWPR